MIPTVNTILSTNLVVKTQPSKNYQLHIENNVIGGVCDGIEAMKQVIFKIINTERYENIIYSWNYGIELSDLFGEPVEYVCPEIERRITESLLQDDRIKSVDNFEFDTTKKRTVAVTFTVHTVFGDVKTEKAVEY